MSKYIDVDRLKVEIERRQETIKSLNFGVKDDHQFVFGQLSAYKGLLSFIDSLQHGQPEVDLKEEFHRWLSKEKEEWGGEIPPYGEYGLFNIARHFYELGLNARKEE